MGRAILRILLGCTLLAAIVGAGYLLVGAPPPAPAVVVGLPRPVVSRGFVGVTTFGSWRLICAADTPPMTPGQADLLAPTKAPANQCRINQEVAALGQPGQVILAANLSVVGPARRPAMMLRLPPTARDGDVIVLRADDVNRVRAIVHGCTPSECLAAADIADNDWKGLLAAKALQVMFPAVNHQPVLVELSADGLAQAASAMTAAQTAMH